MGAKYIPLGTSNSLKSSKYRTPLIKFLNIGRAAFDPVSYLPKVLGLSKPTYTPTTKFELYPMNQASKLLLVVPVLPASGTFKSLSFLPVPLVDYSINIEVI